MGGLGAGHQYVREAAAIYSSNFYSTSASAALHQVPPIMAYVHCVAQLWFDAASRVTGIDLPPIPHLSPPPLESRHRTALVHCTRALVRSRCTECGLIASS